jgi:hypothetical protein
VALKPVTLTGICITLLEKCFDFTSTLGLVFLTAFSKIFMGLFWVRFFIISKDSTSIR